MSKTIEKIIGYGIAGVLTIGGASVVITHDDVAEQFKKNTGRELEIDKIETVSFEESLKIEKQERNEMQAMYNEINCNEYEDYNGCSALKKSLKKVIDGYDGSIDCDNRIVSKNDIEKSDISFCINAQKQLRDSVKDFYIVMDGICDQECQEEIDIYEYNIAMFQAYLNKVN